MNYQTLGMYFAGAFLYSLATYFSKNTQQGGVKWSWKKFLRAVVVGAIVGVYAASNQMSVSQTNYMQVVQASGATVVADQVVKGVYRYFAQFRKQVQSSGSGSGN